MTLLPSRTRTDTIDGPGPDATTSTAGRATFDEGAARRRFDERTAAARTTTETPTITRDDSEVISTPGRRARSSALATMSLMLSLAGALLGIAGIAATSRRHVAGKGDALLGLALGLVAVVVGILALTGNLPWLTSTTNEIMKFRNWLDARVP